MSSEWVNKYAIMRDLSLVQGCVPVDVAGTVKPGDTPPSQNFNEDTEEDYYRNWVGGNGDFAAPDIGLIKHMLEVVKNHEVPTEDEIETERMIQISKLNPLCSEFYPQLLASGAKKPNPQTKQSPKTVIKPQTTKIVDKISPVPVKSKKKTTRNVAVQSLLENIKGEPNVAIENKNGTSLLKPMQFTEEVNTETVDKVSFWLDSQEKKPVNINNIRLNLDPTSMFKKKKSLDVAAPKPEVKRTSPYSCGQYVPSNNAAQYYKEFLECSRMKEMVQQNVWTKVEKQMKQIDERRAAEAELFAISLALCQDEAPGFLAEDPNTQKLRMVCLPCHRHDLPAACRVCDVSRKLTNTVDNTWRNETYQRTKNVGDAWRDDHAAFIEEHVKKIDDFCRKQIKVDYGNNDDENDRSDSHSSERQSDSGFRVKGENNNKIENWRNHNESVDNSKHWRNETNNVDLHIQSWRSKPIDYETPENNRQENKDIVMNLNLDTNFSNTSLASLDDADDIDAWKYEILGDDFDDNNYGSSHETENKYLEMVENTKTYYQAISDKERNAENKTVDNNNVVNENKILAKSKEILNHNFLKYYLKSSVEDDAKAPFEFEITKLNSENNESNSAVQSELKTVGRHFRNIKLSQFSATCDKLNLAGDGDGDDDDDDDKIPIANKRLQMLDNHNDSDD